MKRFVRWLGAFCVLLLLTGMFWGYRCISAERAAEAARAQPTTMPSRVSQSATGEPVVTLTATEQSRSQIQFQTLKAQELQPQVQAIGTLQEDPAGSFVLRAPIAGTLRAMAGEQWPEIGDVLRNGTPVGIIEPRFAPIEQVDLSSKLASVQADAQAATAALAASRADLERVQALNAQNKNVSDKAVQDVRSVVAADEAKLAAAQQTVKLIRSALAAATRPAEDSSLKLSQGGQVVELSARPGETVEVGQGLLRIESFDSLIAAVGISPTDRVDPTTASAHVLVAGRDDQPLGVDRIDLGPAVDPKTLGPTLLLHVNTKALGLRPGTPVMAHLTAEGRSHPGIVVPADAIVWHEGKAWVYVRASETQFVRHQIPTTRPVAGGYFVTSGLEQGEAVVTRGAQQLLSEEFKPALPPGGETDND